MRVLQVTVHFSPNIGGVETHLMDLIAALIKRGWYLSVLTYKPLSVKADCKIYESNNSLKIIRIPWISNLFYKLVSYPFLEFLYLFPGLFIVLPIMLIKDYDVIHGHGLIAGSVSVFWGKIFRKKVIISLHNIYNFPPGLYKNFAKLVFSHSDYILCLSKQSAKEIAALGIEEKKIKVFTYWIDLEKFKKNNLARKKLGWDKKFTVIFVGRLIVEKGIKQLLAAAKRWDKNIRLIVIGSGPLEEEIKKKSATNQNIIFLGKISQQELPNYYSAADILIVPSTSEEGFGRVILESLACGTPVIGAARGAIPEAMNETVGKLITVSAVNIKKVVEFFYKNPDKLNKLAEKSRRFCRDRYSEKNVEQIIKIYKS